MEKNFRAELKSLYRQGTFSGGPYVERFEAAFAKYLGTPYCVGLNSGTSAVHLALLALGIGPGDEVIVPAFTFVGSAWGILYCGAKPVFADSEPDGPCIGPEQVEPLITARTKAVIAVHLFGMACDMAGLKALARKRKIALIEDAAQAHGARWRGGFLGASADIGCFSFYPTKNLGGCGEGGAVTTGSKALAARIANLRNHAQRKRYEHEALGFNYRMDGIQGLFLEKKLAHLDAMNRQRRENAARYLRGIDNPLVKPVCMDPGASVWHLFVCRVKRREAFLKHLDKQGVGHGIHYPLILPRLPPFREFAPDPKRFPRALALAGSVASLPLFYGMDKGQIGRVIEAVNSFKG